MPARPGRPTLFNVPTVPLASRPPRRRRPLAPVRPIALRRDPVAAPAAAGEAVLVRYLTRDPGDPERSAITDRDRANRFAAGTPLSVCLELTLKDRSLAGAPLQVELEIAGQRLARRLTLPPRPDEPVVLSWPLPVLSRGIHYLSLALLVHLNWNHRRVLVVSVVDY